MAFYATRRQPPGPGRERSTRRTTRPCSGRLFTPQAAATVYYLLTDDEGGELAAGVRPTPLAERRPQGKVQRHAGGGRPPVLSHVSACCRAVYRSA